MIRDGGRPQALPVARRHHGRRADPRRPRKATASVADGDRRRRCQRSQSRSAPQPADVPADRQLRGRLRLHLRRPGQHQGSARLRRAALGAAHLGRHAAGRARVRTTFKTRAVHPRRSRASAIWKRENPRFEIDDQRVEVQADAPSADFAESSSTGVEASRSTVSSASWTTRLWTIGAEPRSTRAAIPTFPGNAVVSRRRLDRDALPIASTASIATPPTPAAISGSSASPSSPAARYTAPTPRCRPTSGCCSAALVAARIRTGAFDGDQMLVDVGGMRIPITSVLSGAKLGADGFTDAAKTGTTASMSGRGVAPRRRRRALPDRLDRQDQPRRRARIRRRRHARPPVVGLHVLTTPRSKPAGHLSSCSAWPRRSNLPEHVLRRRTRRWPDARRAGACTTGTSTRRS